MNSDVGATLGYGGCGISRDAAELLFIHQSDFVKLLAFEDEVCALPEAVVQDSKGVTEKTKHTILVVSVFLFVVAFLICLATLTIWAVARRRRKKEGSLDTKGNQTTAELACDEKALSGIVKSSPSLPQIFEKPKFPGEGNSKNGPTEEELRTIRVESIDLTASFFKNRNRIQANVRRVNLSNIPESLKENAFTYLVVSLEPATQPDSSYFESELRPVAVENYFEEASEFEVTLDEISSLSLRVAVYASDRFSQHRLVNAYTYSMQCLEDDPNSDSPSPVLPVTLSETSRTEDNKPTEEVANIGEILFSLCYMPTSGRLTFVALKGRSIADQDAPGTYLRVSLMVGGKTMKTVQTTSIQKSVNPVYNEAFVFHTPLERIKDTDIVVSLLSSEDITIPQPKMLGKVIVGPVSGTNLGRKHWEAMLATPRRPVAQWHSVSEFF